MNITLQPNILTAHLSIEEIELLLKFSDVRKFNSGDVIIAQGETVDGIYVITKGSAVTSARLMGEGTAEIEKYSVGNFLGEMGFIEQIPSPKSIVSTSETHCLFIKHALFDNLTSYQPTLKYNLLNAIVFQICERINSMYTKIIEVISNSDMTSKLTFISKVLDSFNASEKINVDLIGISKEDLHLTPAFSSFNDNEFEILLKLLTPLKAPKRCKLISGSDKNSSIYIVVFGAVQSSIHVDGKFAKLSIVEPGRLFTSPALLGCDNIAKIDFTSCEKIIVMQLTPDKIDHLKQHEIEIWYKIFNLIAHSFAALEKSVYKLDVRLNSEIYNR